MLNRRIWVDGSDSMVRMLFRVPDMNELSVFRSFVAILPYSGFTEQIKFSREQAMARNRHTDDILNVNVGGKRYTVRRTDLLVDPKSKLAEWFKPGTVKQIATDKGGWPA